VREREAARWQRIVTHLPMLRTYRTFKEKLVIDSHIYSCRVVDGMTERWKGEE